MAKVIGLVPEQELKERIRRSRKIRYQKPLKVQFGKILKAALEAKNAS